MNNTLPLGTKVKMKLMGKGKIFTIRDYEIDLTTTYIIPPFAGSFTENSFYVVSVPIPHNLK